MQQLIIGGNVDTTGGADTEYNTLGGGASWTSDTTLVNQIVSTEGSLANLSVELDTAPGVGTTNTFTLVVNGSTVNTPSVAISGTNKTGASPTSIAVSAGDAVYLKCSKTGAPAASIARWSIIFTSTTANESLILGTHRTYDATTTSYSPLAHSNSSSANTSNEANVYQIIPTGGNISKMYVQLSASPGGGTKAYRFTLRKNGSSQTQTCTITGDATTSNDTAHSIAVSAGDKVNIMVEPLNTPTATLRISYGFCFVATTDGESIILGQSNDAPTINTTEYNYPTSTLLTNAWTATEANVLHGGQTLGVLKNLYVLLDGASNGGSTINIRATGASGDTGISAVVANGATTGSDTAHTYTVGSYDDLSISCAIGGTARKVYWGLVHYIASATNVTVSPNVQSGTFSQSDPSITAGTGITVSPNAQAGTFSQSDPTVVGQWNVATSPSTQDGLFALLSPTISTEQNITVSPNVQTGTFTQNDVSVSLDTNIVVSPNVQSLTSSQSNPTITTIRNVVVTPPCLGIGPYAIAYNERMRPIYRVARDIYLTL